MTDSETVRFVGGGAHLGPRIYEGARRCAPLPRTCHSEEVPKEPTWESPVIQVLRTIDGGDCTPRALLRALRSGRHVASLLAMTVVIDGWQQGRTVCARIPLQSPFGDSFPPGEAFSLPRRARIVCVPKPMSCIAVIRREQFTSLVIPSEVEGSTHFRYCYAGIQCVDPSTRLRLVGMTGMGEAFSIFRTAIDIGGVRHA
jgi:hypothetical protein